MSTNINSYQNLAYDFTINAGATTKVFDPNAGINSVDIANRDASLALRLHWGNPWCLSFDGTNDVVACDAVGTLIDAQVKGTMRTGILVTAAGSGRRTIFSIGDTDAETAFYLEVNNDNKLVASIVIAGVVSWALRVDTALDDDVWYTVKLAHDGVEPVIYVNEDKWGQTFTTDTSKTHWLSSLTGIDNGNIGALDYNSAGNANFFQGKIDYLRINNGIGSTLQGYTLDLHYPMDEGTGNLTDRSGNSNTGTVSGATWATKGVGIYHGPSIGRVYHVFNDPDIKKGCWATNAGGAGVSGTYKFGPSAS